MLFDINEANMLHIHPTPPHPWGGGMGHLFQNVGKNKSWVDPREIFLAGLIISWLRQIILQANSHYV